LENACKLKCFDSKSKKICESAPCDLSKSKFGTHERIISHFLKKESWEDAYYYFKDWLHLFKIECDYKVMEVIRAKSDDVELKDYPLGCRVFTILDILKTILTKLEFYENSLDLSDEGNFNYEEKKGEFVIRINQAVQITGHLAMKVGFDRFEKDLYFDKGISFLEKAIEAKEKYGIDVKVPNLIEQEWEKNTKGAGYDPEKDKRREKNEARLKEAKRKALLDKIQKKLMNGEEIDEELREKLRELTEEDNK